MTTTPLPPTKHDHPDVHTIIWTQSELVWIQSRDAQWQTYATAARADLEAENKRLRDHMEAIEQWKAEGEQFFGDPRKTGVLFQIAVWWADRPWRDRAALEKQP